MARGDHGRDAAAQPGRDDPEHRPDAIIVSVAKNEGGADTFWSGITTLVNTALTKNPGASIAITAQNPTSSPVESQGILTLARDALKLRGFAATNGYGFLDVYKAFVTSGLGLASLNQVDGIHPSAATGAPLWTSVVSTAWANAT